MIQSVLGGLRLHTVRSIVVALFAGLLAPLAGAQVDFRASSAAGSDGNIVYIGAGSSDAANGCTTISPGTPGGASGDLLIALLSSGDSATITPSAGWNTYLADNPVGNLTSRIYWRFADGSAQDALTVTKSGTCNVMIGQVARFRGVDAANPFDSGPSAACSSGGGAIKCRYQNANSVTSGTETTVTANALLLLAILISDNNSTNPSGLGFTEVFDSGTGLGNDAQVALSYRQETAAGAKGPFNVNKGGGSDPNHGVLFALRPAAGLTIAVPAGTGLGDVMVAAIAVRPSTVTITPPAGWTAYSAIEQPATNSNRQQLFTRVATASEPGSYTWGFSGAHSGAAGAVGSYFGANTATPVDISGGNVTASDTAHTALSITTGVADTMVIAAHSFASAELWSPPAGMTERADVASLPVANAAGIALELSDVPQAAIGPTGDKTAIAAGSADTGVAQLIALRSSSLRFGIQSGDHNLACPAYPVEVTISARDATGAVLTGYTGLVNLTTTTGAGNWSVGTAQGTLNNGAPNDGAASYQFVAADKGRIVLRLAVSAATTLRVRVQDAASGTTSQGPDINFLDDAYVIVLDPIQVAGRPQTIGVERRTVGSGCNLSQANGHNNNNTIKIWLTLNGSHPGGATLPGATGVSTVSPLGLAEPGGNNITLGFSGGQASFTLNTSDVGKYLINLRDGNSGRRGTSGWITTRPFALAFPGIAHSTSETSLVLAEADADFGVTVAAYLWSAGDDADNNGVPDAGANVTDNGLTPRFAWDTTLAAVPGAILPAGGTTGSVTLGGAAPVVTAAGFSGGSASIANLRYSEVGSVLLQASASAFLDTPGADVSGTSALDGTSGAGAYVGRFKPARFALSGGALLNRQGAGCTPASAFTYMGEPLRLSFTLTAQGAQGATTLNYTGAYARLSLASAAALDVGAKNGSTNLTARLDLGVPPAGSFASGSAALALITAVRRASPDAPDGPFAAAQFGVAPVDPDGVALGTLDFDADGDSTPERGSLGVSTQIRYGRMRLLNATGSENIDLPMTLRTEYWSGPGFATNALDNCSAMPRSAIALEFDAGSPLQACETAVVPASVSFTAGVGGTFKLAAPLAGNSGSLRVIPQIGAAPSGTYCPSTGAGTLATTAAGMGYLLGRWSDTSDPDSDGTTTYDDKPVGRAAFGVYGAQPRNFIFFRENY